MLVVVLLFFAVVLLDFKEIIQREIYSRYASSLEIKIRYMVKGYPIERMIPYISARDKKTAVFLVSVAKKESNWGKYAPRLNGKDCYNYWGYRGESENMTSGGYTCFSGPEEAVRVVAERFDELISDSKLDTPQKMIVWKCGWNCDGQDTRSVSKWIKDVNYYYKKLY